MWRLSRPLCACAIGIGALASCALAMQGCGVIVSSDCAQRAECSREAEAGPMDVATHPPNPESSFANPETGSEAAREAAGTPPDATADAGAHDATPDGQLDSGTDSPAEAAGDAGTDVGADAGADAGNDAGSDAGNDSAMGPPGPRCPAASGGFDSCNTGEHCCVNAPTRATTCAATCDTSAGYYPVDCSGSSGADGCGSQSCCGTLVLDGGPVTNCYVPQLTGSCSDSCNDNFPATLASCMGSYTVRLCTAGADCAAELNGNTSCCNFGNPPSSFNWCVAATLIGAANSCVQ
jgi:hypothetical protein